MLELDKKITPVFLDEEGLVTSVDDLIANATERAGDRPRKPEWETDVDLLLDLG